MALDHYVSQVHLRRFYSPALGQRMYAIRKSDLRQFAPDAKSVCRIEEGNTNEYLVEPRAIEEFLKTVESRYNAAVATLESGKPDRSAIYVISGFVAYVLTCSPAAKRINSEPLKGIAEMTAELLEKKGLILPPPPELGGETLSDLLGSGKIKFAVGGKYPQAIGISNILPLADAYGNCHWDIMLNEHDDCPFFTSDFPTCIEPAGVMGALNRVVPLAPTIAVRIIPDPRRPRKFTNFKFDHYSYRHRVIGRREAVDVNRLLVRAAEDTVFYRDDRLWVVNVVEKNRHFRVESERTEIPSGRGTLFVSTQTVKQFRRS